MKQILLKLKKVPKSTFCHYLYIIMAFLVFELKGFAQTTCDGPYFIIVNDYGTGTHVYSYDDPTIDYPNSCLNGATAGAGEGLVIDYDRNLIYIVSETQYIDVYDGVTGTLLNTINVASGAGIYDVALSLDGNLLYITGDELSVYDVSSTSSATLVTQVNAYTNPYNYNGLWGVDVTPSGDLLVTDGNASNTGFTHVMLISSSDYTSFTNLVTEPMPSAGYGDFEGIKITPDGQSFWVVKQRADQNSPDYLYHYDMDGNLLGTCSLNNTQPVDGMSGPQANAWDLTYG